MAGQVKRRGGIFARNPTRHGQFAMVQPQRVRVKGSREKLKPTRLAAQPWQAQAFEFVHLVGELGYVVHLTANTLAQCDLRVMEAPTAGGDEVVTEDPRALRVMAAFEGPRGGQGELKRRAAMHIGVAGESYLLATAMAPEVGQGIEWEFVSNEELRIDERGAVWRRPDGVTQAVPLPDDVYVARMWESDPRFSEQATSPVRRVIPILAEIVTLGQMVDAAASSRLAAGILYVPDEMSFAGDTEADEDLDPSDDPGQDAIDDFTDELVRHMSAPKEDPSSAASLVPLVLRGPAEHADKVKLIDLGRSPQGDVWAQSLRTEALDRLAKGLDIPPEVLKGKACLTETAEVMTSDGWRGIDTLEPGALVLSLDHDTGTSTWASVEEVHRYAVEDEEMVQLDSYGHLSTSTPHHRWPIERRLCVWDDCDRPAVAKGLCLRCWRRVKRSTGQVPHDTSPRLVRTWVTSAELRDGDYVITGASGAAPAEAKWTDAFVEVAAWAATDADVVGKDGSRVRIRQSPSANGWKVDRIVAALEALGVPYTRSHDRAVGCDEFRVPTAMLADAGEQVGTRFVLSLDFVHALTTAQLHLLLDVGVMANGHRGPSDSCTMFALDPQRLDAFELAACLAGHRVRRWVQSQSEASFGTEPLSYLYWGRENRAGANPSRVRYSGRVWCPTVAGTATFLARDGLGCGSYFTGNSLNHWSAFNIDAELVIKHVVPKLQLLADFLTVAYLRPMLEEYEGMTPAESARFRVDGDASSILGSPDAAASAATLYDRDELSGDALRLTLGFDGGDAPDEEERRQRIALDLIKVAPAIFGPALLHTLTGFEQVDVVVPTTAPAGGGTDPAPPPAPPSKDVQPPDAQGPRSAIPQSVIRDVTVASDAALERALERAASKIISRVEKDVTVRDRVAAARDKRSALATLGPSDLMQVGVTPEQLLEGAWDQLADKAYRWVLPGLEAANVVFPDQAARSMTLRLVAMLDEYAKVHLHSQPTVGPNGLRVPDELVEAALRLEGVRGAS